VQSMPYEDRCACAVDVMIDAFGVRRLGGACRLLQSSRLAGEETMRLCSRQGSQRRRRCDCTTARRRLSLCLYLYDGSMLSLDALRRQGSRGRRRCERGCFDGLSIDVLIDALGAVLLHDDSEEAVAWTTARRRLSLGLDDGSEAVAWLVVVVPTASRSLSLFSRLHERDD
jgi:hypothetical protein